MAARHWLTAFATRESMPNNPSSPPGQNGAAERSTSGLRASWVDTGAATLRHPHGQPAAMPEAGDILAGRYTVERTLGAGTYGRVFSAWDALRSHRVALKVLRETNPAALLRFKHEFRALNESSHPKLVRIFKLGRDEGIWFIVMELLDGVPFLMPTQVGELSSEEHLRARETTVSITRSETQPSFKPKVNTLPVDVQVTPLLDADVTRDRLGQLCQGILALHRLNIVHCDLKPSNVMVTSTGRVVILDFGVSKYTTHLGIHNQDDGIYAGTRPYMAPEIRHVDYATPSFDWYSTGMMLAEVLTGHPAKILANTSYQALTHIFERAGQEYPEYQALYTLCAQLLQPNPEERADHRDILQVCYGANAKHLEESNGDTGDTFVGRARELAVLQSAYETFVEGHPTTIIVEGELGMGKSSLCRRFLRNVMLSKAPPYVLLARCKSDELLGYRAFDEVVDGLTAVLRVMPADVRERLLPYCTPTLCSLFPTLQTIHPTLQDYPEDVSDSPEDALYALHTLLIKVAEQRRIVIWVDDVQHADLDSLRWIARIFGPGSQPNVFLLLSRSPRSSIQETPVDIDTLGYAVPRIVVNPFSEQAAKAAVMNWLPKALRSDDTLVQRILTLSNGRPDSLRSMCHSSELLQHLPEQATLQDLTARRIQALPPLQYEILCIVVLALSSIEFQLITRIVQAKPIAIDVALHSLIKNQLIRPASTVQDEHYEVWEEAVKQGVLALMPAPDQRAMHRRFADIGFSDKTNPMRPALLIGHLVNAHEFKRAQAIAQRLAYASERTGAWESAAQLYDLLFEIQRAQNRRPSNHLILRAIECQTRTGRLEQAADLLTELAENSPQEEAYTLHLRAAETYILCGMLDKGRAQRERANHKASRRAIPKPAAPPILRVLALRAKLAWRLHNFDLCVVDNAPLDETNTALLSTYRVPGIHIGMSDAILGLEFAMRELDLALDLNRPLPIARALASFCSLLAGSRSMSLQRAHQWLSLAQTLAVSSNDRTTLEWVKACRSTVDYQFGYYRKTSEQLDQSHAWLTTHASHQSLILAHLDVYRLIMAISRGDIPRVRDIYYAQLADARMRNNQPAEAAVTLLGSFTWFVDDAPRAARAALDRIQIPPPRAGRHVQLNHILWTKSLADLCLYEQTVDEYAPRLKQYERLERSMILGSLDALRHEVRLSQSRLIFAQSKHTGKLHPNAAKRLHHWGNNLSQSSVPLSRGWGHHILAGVHYLEGHENAAKKHLLRSIDTHQSHGLELFAQLSRAAGATAELLYEEDDIYQTLRVMGVVRPERLMRSFHPYI